MPRGRTRSSLNRSQRIEEAHKLFARGFSNADVARELKISADTATTYRRLYEEGLTKQAASNPQIFSEVLRNTQRALIELDQVRSDAWAQIRKLREYSVGTECPECGFAFTAALEIPINDSNRTKYHKIILAAQHERAQLHQLLTNRTEVLIKHENTRIVQEKILAWLGSNLALSDREKLALFIETELSEYMRELPPGNVTGSSLDDEIIDAEIIE